MAFLVPFIPLIVGAMGVGASIYSTSASKTAASKARNAQQDAPAPLPTAPTEGDAQAKAAEDMQTRRRISMLSGGDTDVTKGKALVAPADSAKKTLLGA